MTAPRRLWITVADPDPAHNGQFVYSGGLIRSLTEAGAAVTVLGLRREMSDRRKGGVNDGITWRLVPGSTLPRWTSLWSGLPNVAHRCYTRDMGLALRGLLHEGHWDAILFDGISSGWALARVSEFHRQSPQKTKLVYISHNHESSLRRTVAHGQSDPIKRLALHADAGKTARLEHELVDACDLITAITDEDAALYRRDWPQKRVEVLLPGFGGDAVAERHLDSSLPRRAVLVGSFDWIAKRMNLEDFISFADPMFAANGIELHVIGSCEPTFLETMRRRVVTTRFIGKVDSIRDYMLDARVAVVPERHGGGFKLKALDYVFGRIPILALKGSVAGMPLRDEESILSYPDQEALARGVVDSIDDIDRLDKLQCAALDACRERFDWSSRGEQLITAIAA